MDGPQLKNSKPLRHLWNNVLSRENWLQSYAQVHRPPHYHYSYQVMDPQYEGAQYGQQEFRHGEKTQGEYHVRLPDGRYQSVNYQVDGAAASGFIADVSYDEGM